MPIYEYQCAVCGRVTEKWQKISEPPLSECPACGGSLTKLISSCAFHLKGSGWYVTDSGGSKAGAASDKVEDAKTTGGSDEAPKAKETDKSDSSPPPKFK